MKRSADSYEDETDDNDSDNHSGGRGRRDGRDGQAPTAPAAAAAAAAANESSSNTAVDDYKQRCRELNRISKIRCRQRRKDRVKELEAEIARLSAEHQSLQVENGQLRQEFASSCSSAQQQPEPQQQRMPVAQVPMFHQSPALVAAAAAVNTSAHLQFPNGFSNNIAPPVWDSNQLAWLGSQQQQQQHLLQQQQAMVPTPSQQLLSLGAPPQDIQRLDPRLLPFMASLQQQNNDTSTHNMFHLNNMNMTLPIHQGSEFAQAQLPSASTVSDWLRTALLQQQQLQQQATPSQQQQTFQPGIPERHYEASSEHSSEGSESKNASV